MDKTRPDSLALARQRTGRLAENVNSYDELVKLARAHAEPHAGERMPPWYRPLKVMKVAHGRQYCPAKYDSCEDDRCRRKTYENLSVLLGLVVAGVDAVIVGLALPGIPVLYSAIALFFGTIYLCALKDRRIIWEQHVLAPRQKLLKAGSEADLVRAYISHELERIEADLTGPNSEVRRLTAEAGVRLDRMRQLKHRLLLRLKKDGNRAAIQLALRRLLRAIRRIEDCYQSLEQHSSQIQALLDEFRDRIMNPLTDIPLLREAGELIEAVDPLIEQSEQAVIDSIAELHRKVLGLGQQIQALSDHAVVELAELPGFELEDHLKLIEAHAEATARLPDG
ncbi:MAG: hypothetical protein ACK2UH_16760 [Candidatus Promineifilaceae bacterium]